MHRVARLERHDSSHACKQSIREPIDSIDYIFCGAPTVRCSSVEARISDSDARFIQIPGIIMLLCNGSALILLIDPGVGSRRKAVGFGIERVKGSELEKKRKVLRLCKDTHKYV